MADELRIAGFSTGLTIKAQVLEPDGTQLGTDVTLTASGTPPIYRGDIPGGAVTGQLYDIAFFEDGDGFHADSYSAIWDGTQLVFSNITAASIWTYATRTLTSSANVTSTTISGNSVEIVRGVTFTDTVSGLTIPATWTKMYYTIKCFPDTEAETDAIVQIVESNPAAGGDGLLYLNGATATASEGSVSTNQGAGTVSVTIADEATAALKIGSGYAYDIKVLLSDGTSQLLSQNGSADVVSTPTRSIT